MTVEILFVPDCPHHGPATRLVNEVLQEEGLRIEVRQIRVADLKTAQRLRFPGSPTIRVNEVDVEPELGGERKAALACRIYAQGRNLPSRAQVRNAIRTARSGK